MNDVVCILCQIYLWDKQMQYKIVRSYWCNSPYALCRLCTVWKGSAPQTHLQPKRCNSKILASNSERHSLRVAAGGVGIGISSGKTAGRVSIVSMEIGSTRNPFTEGVSNSVGAGDSSFWESSRSWESSRGWESTDIRASSSSSLKGDVSSSSCS